MLTCWEVKDTLPTAGLTGLAGREGGGEGSGEGGGSVEPSGFSARRLPISSLLQDDRSM